MPATQRFPMIRHPDLINNVSPSAQGPFSPNRGHGKRWRMVEPDELGDEVSRVQPYVHDTLPTAVRTFQQLGQPGIERLGITALDNPERQYVWLDDADGR